MKLLGLLAGLVIALAVAEQPRNEWWHHSSYAENSITDKSIKTNREYKFVYNGQLATGIPGASEQHSATRVQALVSLVIRSDKEALLKLQKVRFGKLDAVITPRNIVDYERFDQIDIDQNLEKLLHKTVKFQYEHGMVKDIEFDVEEQPWSANIKRAVLNLLQVNLNKERQIGRNEEIDAERTTFVCMEKSVEGDCETMYTVLTDPKTKSESLKIKKSINFDNCEIRPVTRYNERFQQICPSCENRYSSEERTLRSSTITDMTLRCEPSNSNKCLIERTVIESQYNFVLFGEENNVITSYARQELKLVKSGAIESDVTPPSSPIRSDSGMVYTLDEQIEREMFYLEGKQQYLSNTPYSKIEDKIYFTKQIIKTLIETVRSSVNEHAPRQFTRLVEVMREMTKSELQKCQEELYSSKAGDFTKEEHNQIQQLLVDAWGLCYTKNCMDHLIENIETNKISSARASVVLRKLMDAPFVTKEMVKKLMSICETGNKCERHGMLKQAVYLTAGSMMRTMCVNTRDKLAVEYKQSTAREVRCSTSTKIEFIEKLMRKFHESSSENERMLCLKTLSNAGLELSVKPLEKIIYNEEAKYTENNRIEAILALRQLVDQIPKKIVKILLPIYTSRRQSPAIRVVALYEIMNCVPDKLVIDQITRSLVTERHPQVSAFTFTTLNSFANSSNPCEKQMSEDIKLSMRHARHVPYSEWSKRSKFVRVIDANSESSRIAYSFDYGKLYSSKSPYLQRLFFGLNLNVAKQWSPRFVSLGINQSGLGRIIKRIVTTYSHTLESPLTKLFSGKMQMPSSNINYRDELNEIVEKLTVNRDMSSASSIESSESESASNENSMRNNQVASMFMEFKNQQYGYLSMDEELIPSEIMETITSLSTMNSFVSRARHWMKDMSTSFNVITGTFVHEQVIRIPSSMGLPIQVSVKLPTVMQASGVGKIELVDGMKRIKMSVEELKPSVVMTAVATMECWSPIVNTGLKVLASTKAFLPISVSLEIDSTKSTPEIDLSLSPITRPDSQKEEEIFMMETRPITYSLVWPKSLKQWKEPSESTIYSSEFSRVHKHNLDFGAESFGLKLNSRQNWHRVPKEAKAPSSLFVGPNRYVVTMTPGFNMPEKYCVKIMSKWFEPLENPKLSVDFKNIYSGRSTEYLNADSSEENMKTDSYYKSYKGSSWYDSEIEIEATTKGSTVKREASLALNWKCDKEEKACKAKFSIKRSPLPHSDSKPWKFTTEWETLYPKMPMTMRDISKNDRIVSKIETRWGNENSMDNKFDIKLVAEQSRKMGELRERSLYSRLFENENHRNNHKSLFSPVAQYEHVERYSLMDEIKFDIDYAMPKYSENTLYNWFNMLKHKYYDQTYVSLTDTTRSGRVQGKLNVDPVNRRYVNITVRTPEEKVRIVDMPLSMKLSSLNLRRMSSPSSSFVRQVTDVVYGNTDKRAMCQMRTDRINTFDQVEVEVPTSTCYSVLAKDCSSRDNGRFAVLVKKNSKLSEKKTVKIVTEHTKLVMKGKGEAGEIECNVNAENKPCHDIGTVFAHGGHVVLRCQKYESIMKCELPEEEVTVYFDGYSANLKVSEYYRSSVCGLCGQFDENKLNELENFNEHRLSNRRQLYDSYLIREETDATCEHDTELLVTRNDARQQSRRTYSVNDNRYDNLPESIASPLRSSTWQVRPIEATGVLEQNDEICFTKRPVKKCPRDTYANEYEKTPVKVVYACLPRGERETDRLYYALSRATYDARGRDVIETDQLVASFTQKQRQPKSCRQY